MSLTYDTSAEDTEAALALLNQALESGNLTEEQRKDVERKKRRLERRRRKELAREERLKNRQNKNREDEESKNEPSSVSVTDRDRRLRSQDLPFIPQSAEMNKQASTTSGFIGDLINLPPRPDPSDVQTSTPQESFTCLCSTCGDRGSCTSNYYCTAITHRGDDGTPYTTYGCVNSGSFMELAYCKGGEPGNSRLNTLSTVCCKGNYCNNIAPPALHSTTSQVPADSTNNSSASMGMLPAAVYLLVPAILIVILLALIVFFVYKTHKSAKKRRLQKMRIKNYLGDNLSAQPLTEDCSIELPDTTSGSGSGMPMLMQRTVAKSVTLVDQIGTGRYGSVYSGVYQGSLVAVKIFLSKDIESWTRENEIYTTLLLRHDNILGFLASDMISCDSVTQFWLICQYHENGSLYDYLNQPYNPITLTQALKMLHSAAAGMVHLHTEITASGMQANQAKPAIAHRDIKSKNILVKDDRTCCIADLGLAVTHKSKENVLDLGNNTKVGTKRYMAPEVLADSMNHSDFESYKRADVYAFSLVMWETMQCAIKDGHAAKYQMPYGNMVPNDPSFEEMRHVVVTLRLRPAIPSHWANHKVFKAMAKLIQECWCETPAARLTILRIKKTLANLLEEAADCKEFV